MTATNPDLEAMTLAEFNSRFLVALKPYDPRLKHLASGSNGRHPPFRSTLIADCRQDIKIMGFQRAKEKWQHFVGIPKTEGETIPDHRKGRKPLLIPLKIICDTLYQVKSIKDTAEKLGCSRGYIYREVGKDKIGELIK